jgi:transposase InsO family protein
MPRPIPLPVRQKLFDRFTQGESAPTLARAFHLPERTVRALCARFRGEGPAGITPRYRQLTGVAAGTPLAWREVACQLRRDHPSWGAGLIRVVLGEQFPEHPWPSERSLQRWLKQAKLSPAPSGRRPHLNPSRATRPHQTWQMDAAEAIRLADNSCVCWLRLVDEFSGAVLRTTVFARKRWPHVGGMAVQADLRQAFALWGRPSWLRVDNGVPWRFDEGLPPELACWLIGLGVEVTWNPPHHPQANGVVERSQGIGKA